MTAASNNKPKPSMKINRSEFKSIVKECLRELVSEGALSQTIKEILSEGTVVDPRARATAPAQSNVMEAIFADTLRVSIPQMRAAENAMLPTVGMEGMHAIQMVNEQQQFPRNPLPPKEAQALPVQQQANPWARLAFNKPISNRPATGAGANSSHLPGVNRGGGF